MLDELKTEKKVVGIKQLRRALTDQTAELVFLAPFALAWLAWAHPHDFGALAGHGISRPLLLAEPLMAQCREGGVEVVSDVTMAELGKACGISVGAAAAAILRR